MKKILLIIILLNTNLIQAQNPDSIPPTESRQDIQYENQNSDLSELDYYKLLYENSEKNRNSITSLIQWSLGISLGFLIAIIGSQIFFNYRLNKKELDYIKKDIDEKVLELEARIIEKNQKKYDEIENNLNSHLTTIKEDSKKFIESEFESTTKLKDAQFKLLEKTVDFEIRTIKNSLDKEVNGLKKDIIKNEGDLWKLKGVEANALSSFIKVAFIKSDLKEEIKYILDDIIKVLNDVEDIHEMDYKELKKLYEKIKISHKTKADQINELIKNKDVYAFETSSPTWNTGMLGLAQKKIIKINKKKN